MNQIRYQQRICTDNDQIDRFLTETRTGILGIYGAEYPYCVPVNYIWKDGFIYFHGLGSGKKNDLMETNPKVSFTVYKEYGTVKDPVPCHADTSYLSVMLFGTVKKISDLTETAEVLQELVQKFMPGFYQQKISSALVEKYRSSHDNKAVAIYKIKVMDCTAKVNSATKEEMF